NGAQGLPTPPMGYPADVSSPTELPAPPAWTPAPARNLGEAVQRIRLLEEQLRIGPPGRTPEKDAIADELEGLIAQVEGGDFEPGAGNFVSDIVGQGLAGGVGSVAGGMLAGAATGGRMLAPLGPAGAPIGAALGA